MPCKRAAVSIGALLENMEGVRLLRLERKRQCISGFLFLDPEDIKGPSGTLARNGVPLSLYQWGTKGPFIRPRCIGTARARTQMLT